MSNKSKTETEFAQVSKKFDIYINTNNIKKWINNYIEIFLKNNKNLLSNYYDYKNLKYFNKDKKVSSKKKNVKKIKETKTKTVKKQFIIRRAHYILAAIEQIIISKILNLCKSKANPDKEQANLYVINDNIIYECIKNDKEFKKIPLIMSTIENYSTPTIKDVNYNDQIGVNKDNIQILFDKFSSSGGSKNFSILNCQNFICYIILQIRIFVLKNSLMSLFSLKKKSLNENSILFSYYYIFDGCSDLQNLFKQKTDEVLLCLRDIRKINNDKKKDKEKKEAKENSETESEEIEESESEDDKKSNYDSEDIEESETESEDIEESESEDDKKKKKIIKKTKSKYESDNESDNE